METITIKKQTNEEVLLQLIQDFFDCKKLTEHLRFLDYWLKKSLVNLPHKKHLNLSDLRFLSAKFHLLLISCYKIYTKAENPLYFEETLKIPESYIIKERALLPFYPASLRTKEICNPLLAFQNIFKNHDLNFYTLSIEVWLNQSLSKSSKKQNVKIIFQTYMGLKKMIEACWLIHERTISKHSYSNDNTLDKKNLTYNFALSCPLLLADEYLTDPYLMVEEFFSFASINEYREDLTKWFKAALNDEESYENANDLLFIHNQFTQLIHAGYLIGAARLPYLPKPNYTPNYDTFSHWLLAREADLLPINHVRVLSPHYKDNPIDYCSENLTIDHIVSLRYGLKEWLECGLSKHSNITDLAHTHIFDQFEELQKIMEALFLIIIQPAIENQFTSASTIN